MREKIWGMALTAASLSIAIGTAAARPVVPAENRFSPYSSQLPLCDDPGVLSRIQDRFAQKESEYWNSDLRIVSYARVSQIGFRTTGLDYVPRRYCTARALVSDNRSRHVVYWIGEDFGIIGWGYGVEWCVVGLDRNFAYGPACRAAYP